MLKGKVAPHQAILTSIGMIHAGGTITSDLLKCEDPVKRFKRYETSGHIIDVVEVRKKPVEEAETVPRIAGQDAGNETKKNKVDSAQVKEPDSKSRAPKSTQAGGPKKPRKQRAGGSRQRRGAAKAGSGSAAPSTAKTQ